MRRGFCRSNDNVNTGEGCDTSGLANFSHDLDSSLIVNQKRNFIRLVTDQVDELKKKTVSCKNQRGLLGRRGSRANERGVRFRSATSRPGFCTDDCGGSTNPMRTPNPCASSSEPKTDYEADGEDCNVQKSSARLPLRKRVFGNKGDKTQIDPCSLRKHEPICPDPCLTDPCPSDPCLPDAASTPAGKSRPSPRAFMDECNDVANRLTSGLPACAGHRQRSNFWSFLLLLLLLLLLLAALAYFFVLRSDGPDSNDCSAGTVRYVPY